MEKEKILDFIEYGEIKAGNKTIPILGYEILKEDKFSVWLRDFEKICKIDKSIFFEKDCWEIISEHFKR